MGTIKYIHVTCLKEWIKEKKSVMCELCHTEYTKKVGLSNEVERLGYS